MKYQDYLKKYAELILKVGVNLQEGQQMILNCSTECLDLAEEILKVAYKDIKSGKIHVKISDDRLSRVTYENASLEALSTINNGELEYQKDTYNYKMARLFISAPNPTLLAGIDPEKISQPAKVIGLLQKDIRANLDKANLQWCIAAYVGEAWAKMVFPDLEINEAKEKLWDLVFKACRIYEEDTVKAWQEHVKRLHKQAEFLNNLNVKEFHYKSAITDFRVGMPEGYIFEGAGAPSSLGKEFVPNLPTEEIFSMPNKHELNGRLASTMPLNLRGTLIKDFYFDFKDGQVVNFGASEGYDALKLLLETDEGSKSLGEIALIPVDSPISNLHTLFYMTLFDENASCHFALGNSYKDTIKGGMDMTSEEWDKVGANESIIHVDFMVGSRDLDIIATTRDGKEVQIFKDGNWAI